MTHRLDKKHIGFTLAVSLLATLACMPTSDLSDLGGASVTNTNINGTTNQSNDNENTSDMDASGVTDENDNSDGDSTKNDNSNPDIDDTPIDDGPAPDPSDNPDFEVPETSVRLTTTLGDIVVEMNTKEAPITVANFLQYVKDGFYDGTDGAEPTIFHRVIPGFVVQGGGLTEDLVGKETRDPIANESDNGLLNLRGTLSMARTNKPDSATSQFFINLADNASLDMTESSAGYAVFAMVVEGKEVVDKMATVETTIFFPFSDVPKTPIIITSAEIIE